MIKDNKRKLYLFSSNCYAMADDGLVLGRHVCAHPSYMLKDLVLHPTSQKRIKEHFGVSYEEIDIIECKLGEIPPQDVVHKNIELGWQVETEKNNV